MYLFFLYIYKYLHTIYYISKKINKLKIQLIKKKCFYKRTYIYIYLHTIYYILFYIVMVMKLFKTKLIIFYKNLVCKTEF